MDEKVKQKILEKHGDKIDEIVLTLTNERRFYKKILPYVTKYLRGDITLSILAKQVRYHSGGFLVPSIYTRFKENGPASEVIGLLLVEHYREEIEGYNNVTTQGVFKVGDRVVISPNSKFYGGSTANPADVGGEVVESDTYNLGIHVKWDNGGYNGYNQEDLALEQYNFKVGDVVRKKDGEPFFDGTRSKTQTIKDVRKDGWYGTTENSTVHRSIIELAESSLDEMEQEIVNHLEAATNSFRKAGKLLTKEETKMSEKLFETKVFVNGQEAKNVSDDDIFVYIAQQEGRIASLNKTVAKPAKLQEKIKAMQAEIESLVEYVDQR